jgi:tRNA(fMet)-specific endonuclease VapC
MYLLDTNHCSRVIFGDSRLANQLADKARTNTAVSTCVIVRGELIYMAEKSEQRQSNLMEVEAFFEDIFTYPVDQNTATIYGQLKVAVINYFGPKEKSKRRRVRIEDLGVHENDFQRMRDVSALQVENWLS